MIFRHRAGASQHFGRRTDEADDEEEKHHVRNVLEYSREERLVRRRDEEREQKRDDAERNHQGPQRAELPDVGSDGCEQQQVGDRRPGNGRVAGERGDADSGNVAAKASLRIASQVLADAWQIAEVEDSCTHWSWPKFGVQFGLIYRVRRGTGN